MSVSSKRFTDANKHYYLYYKEIYCISKFTIAKFATCSISRFSCNLFGCREEFAWSVYFLPFSTMVWPLLVLNGLFSAVVLRFLFLCSFRDTSTFFSSSSSSLSRYLSSQIFLFFSVLLSYLGKPLSPRLAADPASLRVGFLVVCFFCSTVVWSVYRAALTSELVAQVIKKPFDSLETFYNTDYQ